MESVGGQDERDPHAPSCTYTGDSSPLAVVVSFARRDDPLARIAFLRASALSAALDISVKFIVRSLWRCWEEEEVFALTVSERAWIQST